MRTAISKIVMPLFLASVLTACANQIGGFTANEKPSTPEKPSGPGGSEETTNNLDLRIGDQFYIDSAITNIFGDDSDTQNLIDQELRSQTAVFGGACDPYEKSASRTFKSDGTTLSFTPSCPSLSDTTATSIPKNSPVREAYRMRLCLKLSSSLTAVGRAIQKAKNLDHDITSNDLSLISNSELESVYELFYFPAEPTQDIISSLSDLVARVEVLNSSQPEPIQSLESWKAVLMTLCASPDWQAL